MQRHKTISVLQGRQQDDPVLCHGYAWIRQSDGHPADARPDRARGRWPLRKAPRTSEEGWCGIRQDAAGQRSAISPLHLLP